MNNPVGASEASDLSADETARIYTHFKAQLLRRCEVMLGDRSLAEDVLHDAMIKVLRYGAKLRAAESPSSWLACVVARCCFDELNRRRAETALVAALPVRARSTTDADAVRSLEQRQELERGLAALNDGELALLYLCHMERLAHAEVAKRVGCSRQTLNARLKAIRSKVDAAASDGS